ncbi:MAG TPA: MFS transporter [Propioniciclava sp.]|uniref:MFS transporter n=2 Tax=Propioniciclava sp. TaxID=2038686 RepID=UPI002CEA1585|nr:MFS transporter [Propioniciclava sp.]HRL50038.1 MFS transporter [Propioniciclava sp.]
MTREQMSPQHWRTLTVSVYLPTTLALVGFGAVTPLIAITAQDLGASLAQSALVVSLLGIGALVGALPAGIIADRLGEQRALVASLIVDAAAMAVAAFAPNFVVLGIAVFVLGVSEAVVTIARQSFVTEFVPLTHRARALSTLGGVFRIGSFIGPLAGAAVVTLGGLRAAYWLAIATSLAAAIISAWLPDVEREAPPGAAPVHMAAILRAHAMTFLTLGVGAAALTLVRASRDALLPLWATSIGLDAAQTSLVFAASSLVDLTLFYLGGSMMDRLGRRAVAVPAMLIMGTCFGLLPLAATGIGLGAVALGLGLGNGISAGVVMTLGSDASPAVGRTQFLAGWRLTTGIGGALGPVMISALAAVASLSAAALAVAAIGWLGAAWLWHWASPPGDSPASRDASAS